jgi:two-component system, cell cycle response regulator
MRLTSPARILVVEDNGTNRALIVYLLKAFGYKTLEATDGERGLDIARHERPELIVCDVHLPKLDGYRVVDQLKRDVTLRDIPVVAVSALAMVGDRNKILSAGFDGYISKPIEPETFVAQVAAFLPSELRSEREYPAIANSSEPALASQLATEKCATILVVDDRPAHIEFARSALEPAGYKVLEARGLNKALELADRIAPDVVLCDLDMQRESGHDLLELAGKHKHLATAPLVIISSIHPAERERLAGLERGATRFIKRPMEPQALRLEIAAALHEAKRTES